MDNNARKSARGSTTPRREHSEGPVRVSRADAPQSQYFTNTGSTFTGFEDARSKLESEEEAKVSELGTGGGVAMNNMVFFTPRPDLKDFPPSPAEPEEDLFANVGVNNNQNQFEASWGMQQSEDQVSFKGGSAWRSIAPVKQAYALPQAKAQTFAAGMNPFD